MTGAGGAWPWVAVAMLGAYHGVDPSMGWLFAVALGLQDKSRARVLWALIPIAIGHLLSIAVVVALVGGLRMASFNPDYVRYGGAAALIAFGMFRLIWPRAHPRWVAMRVNSAELALWSFLMASAHGAGLMLFPILMNVMPAGHAMMHHHHAMPPMGATLPDRRDRRHRPHLGDAGGDGHHRDRDLREGRPRDFAQRMDQPRHDLGESL